MCTVHLLTQVDTMVSVSSSLGKKRQIPLAFVFLHLIFIIVKLKFDNESVNIQI